jgi:hypothetical protein
VDGVTIVCCDGAEQLSWWDWRRLMRHSRAAAGLLITTHHPGRLPTLHECETTPALLQSIAGSLDEGVLSERCDELFALHKGNLREAIRSLYDDWSLPAAGSQSSGQGSVRIGTLFGT